LFQQFQQADAYDLLEGLLPLLGGRTYGEDEDEWYEDVDWITAGISP